MNKKDWNLSYLYIKLFLLLFASFFFTE
jgi:hypothetical protein